MTDRQRPPGPVGKWFGIGLLQEIRDDFRRFSHELHLQYGDVVYYRVFGRSI